MSVPQSGSFQASVAMRAASSADGGRGFVFGDDGGSARSMHPLQPGGTAEGATENLVNVEDARLQQRLADVLLASRVAIVLLGSPMLDLRHAVAVVAAPS
jgi:hypothetical protein